MKLKVGRKVRIKKYNQNNEGTTVTIENWTVAGIYKKFIRFENKHGVSECYITHDVVTMLRNKDIVVRG